MHTALTVPEPGLKDDFHPWNTWWALSYSVLISDTQVSSFFLPPASEFKRKQQHWKPGYIPNYLRNDKYEQFKLHPSLLGYETSHTHFLNTSQVNIGACLEDLLAAILGMRTGILRSLFHLYRSFSIAELKAVKCYVVYPGGQPANHCWEPDELCSKTRWLHCMLSDSIQVLSCTDWGCLEARTSGVTGHDLLNQLI